MALQRGSRILDPCFSLDAATIVCGANPATGETGFPLRLSKPLPPAEVPPAAIENAKRNGWLIRLQDGTLCNIATGATSGAEGKRLNDACSDRRWVLGDLQPGDPWTPELVTGAVGPNGFAIATRETVVVATVWQ